jgi:hypothetical protein
MTRVRGILPARGTQRANAGWIASAAALLMVGLAALLWQTVLHAPAPSAKAHPSLSKVDVEHALAMLVRLDGVRWEQPEEPHPREGEFLAAGRLRIRSGRITLSMLSGVMLTLEGPADLDLISIDRVFCRLGKLRTRVPKGAEGLAITTPTSAVLDLGTEFGLNVEAGATGKSLVKVFEGKAEAVLNTGAGNQNISQIIRGGKAIEIDPAAVRIKVMEGSADFIESLDVPTPPLALDPAYPGAVLAAHPWSYWRFEAVSEGAIANEVSTRPSLLIQGPVHIGEPNAENHAAVFRAGEKAQYLLMDGSWEPEPHPGYAAELWFLPESIDHSSLISMASPKDTNKHAFFLELGSRNRHAIHPPSFVRFLDRSPPALDGGYNIYSRTPYVPGRWHHLVGQMNEGRMELFLDGEPTYSLPTDLGHATKPCQVILGRLSTLPIREGDDTLWFHGRPFAGRLDEVALYNHPLSLEEVRLHHRLGSRQAVGARAIQSGLSGARTEIRPAAGSGEDRRTEAREK